MRKGGGGQPGEKRGVQEGEKLEGIFMEIEEGKEEKEMEGSPA